MIILSRIVGLKVVGVGLCLMLLIAFAPAEQAQRPSSKYQKPAVYDGLYYAKSGEVALVLSYNDKPIPPKENDPDAPTKPGFYPSDKERFEFQRIEVIGEKVYFKTRGVNGKSYEFVGKTGGEIFPDFDPSTPVHFIEGALTTLKNGKPVNKEIIKFSHAIIA